MLERFTERARRAIVRAIEEARGRRHAEVGPEHLLLALIRTDVFDPRVLRHAGLNLEPLIEEIERALATIPPTTKAAITPVEKRACVGGRPDDPSAAEP